MRTRTVGYVVAGVLAALALLYLGLATGALGPVLGGYDPADPAGYDHATVTVVDGETGAERGSVEAAVADSFRTRYVGLSQTDDLPRDRGMFFVHDDESERTYVMRSMSFGIDIVFVGADGTITEIHEAPEPEPGEDGSDQRYTGVGQYVLEVNLGWSADHGVEEGDELVVEGYLDEGGGSEGEGDDEGEGDPGGG